MIRRTLIAGWAIIAGGCGFDPRDIVGTDFVPGEPVVACHKDFGIDSLGFILVRLPTEAARRLESDAQRLGTFPTLSNKPGLVSVQWKSGALTPEAAKALDLASDALDSRSGSCDGVPPPDALARIHLALTRSTTFHSYQYHPVNGEVAPEGLIFRVLDLSDGVLYILENFS